MQDSEALFFIPGFLCMWLGILWMLAQLGGWARTARRFAAPSPPTRACLASKWFVSGTVGWANYSNTWIVELYPDHLCLKTLILYRFAHPSLCIPRDAMTNVSYSKGWFGLHRFRFTVEGTRFSVCGSMATRLNAWHRQDEDSGDMRPRRLT